MPNGRPGDSRHHDIVHHGLEVYGPSCDALIREITARLPRHRLGEFQNLVESWPFEADGRPHDLDALFHRLIAFRESLGSAPAPSPSARASVPATGRPAGTAPVAPAAVPRRGSPLGGLVGLVLGGAIGLPIGFLAYLVAREALLSTRLWSSDAVMWAVVLAVAAPAALAGLKQGAAPSRMGHALLIGMLGFLLGGMLAGTGAGLLAMLLGSTDGMGDRAMGQAIGVVFGLMPLAALVGGAALGLRMGRRAWRNWRGDGPR